MIAQGASGTEAEILFSLTNATTGNPITGKSWTTGELKVMLPGTGFVDATVANIFEYGLGAYALRLTSGQTASVGKCGVRTVVTGAAENAFYFFDVIEAPGGTGTATGLSVPQSVTPAKKNQPVEVLAWLPSHGPYDNDVVVRVREPLDADFILPGVPFAFGSKATAALLAGTRTLNLQWKIGGTYPNAWGVSLVGGGGESIAINYDTRQVTINYNSGVSTSATIQTLIGASSVCPFVVSSTSGASSTLTSPGSNASSTFATGTDGTLMMLQPTANNFAEGSFVRVTVGAGYTDFNGVGVLEIQHDGTAPGHVEAFFIVGASEIVAGDLSAGAVDKIAEGIHDLTIEDGRPLGDILRLVTSIISGKVSNFGTNTLVFKSLDGTKSRITVTTDSTGRTNIVIGDLT